MIKRNIFRQSANYSTISISLVIPRREVQTQSPDGFNMMVFPSYMSLVNENWSFLNTNVIRPFSKRKPLSPEGMCLSTPAGVQLISFDLNYSV